MSTTLAPVLYTDGSCFPYEISINQSFWDADPLAAGLAFFFGTLLGAGIGVLCAWLCLRDLRRSKDGERVLGVVYTDKDTVSIVREEHSYYEQKSSYKAVTFIDRSKVAPSPDQEPDMKMSIKRKRSSKRRRPGTGREDPTVPIALVSIGDEIHARGTRSTSKGLADALLMNNGEGMDAELSQQDLDSVKALDNDLREENINTMVQMLRVLLQQQMAKGTMKEEDMQHLMKIIQNDVSGVVTIATKEREEQEEELKKKYEKDPDKLDVELEKLHGKQMTRINTLLGETTQKLRLDIGRNSAMKEEEIDALMEELNYNLSESERRLAEQRTKQTLALEDRLARRKNMAEMHRYQKEQQETDIEVRKEVHEKSLQELVEDGKMLERQKDDLLDAYSDDQERIYKRHQEEMQKQQLHLAEKLAANREKKMAALADKQEQEREDFVRQADANTNTESVRESFHKMLEQQRQERDDVQEDLDNEEAEQFNGLIKKEEKLLKEELNETEERLLSSLTSRADLSESEAERIMTIHQAEMSEYEKSKKNEKKRMQQRMEEKLEQRRQRAEEETMLAQAEQQTLVEQQTNTIQKVLNSQVEIDQDAKEKILQEHEQQMAKVNNQLQMSKLRQQKALEQRLSKRRAKVANLKDEQERLRKEAKDGKEKEKEKMAQELEKQIQAEEKALEDMKKNQLAELRRTLAAETAEALNEQEKQLSVLIARLEVGQARRKALIERQDKTIKELETKMVDKVGDNPADLPGRKVDAIINQHSRDIEALEDKMTEARDRQEASLQERLQAKRLKKERQMERQIETEAQEDWEDQRKRGAGLATNILGQVMIEQRHKMAMEQLSREMQQEMQKQREELNQELEREMKAELEEQKKSFLAKLAAISNMSKEEISQVVENAVTDAGGDEKEAKKLSKEMRIEMKRAKTELHGNDDRDYSPPLRRHKSDMYDDEEPLYRKRPKSGKRPQPKRGFEGDDY